MNKEKRISAGWEMLMIAVGVLFIYPVILVGFNSFKQDGEIMTNIFTLPAAFHFQNYITAWTDMKFMKSFLNSLTVTVAGTAGIVAISSMAGYKLSRTKTKYSTIFFYICITPMVISFSSIMITFVKMLKILHMLNSIYGLIFVYCGLFAPAAIFLYHGFVKSVPAEVEESARLDGCGSFRTFTSIVFPLLKPVTGTIIILNAMAIWNDFLLPLLTVAGSEKTKTLILSAYTFVGLYNNSWSKLLAGLVMAVIPITIFFIMMQRFIVQGITAGAVK